MQRLLYSMTELYHDDRRYLINILGESVVMPDLYHSNFQAWDSIVNTHPYGYYTHFATSSPKYFPILTLDEYNEYGRIYNDYPQEKRHFCQLVRYLAKNACWGAMHGEYVTRIGNSSILELRVLFCIPEDHARIIKVITGSVFDDMVEWERINIYNTNEAPDTI